MIVWKDMNSELFFKTVEDILVFTNVWNVVKLKNVKTVL